ncbi:MAG: hypothetical protein HZY76_15730 [Anaerolineae bacterium]|nr:MAG: hypothetical protein HZY76_15730 [Anaerolineae bacterium]
MQANQASTDNGVGTYLHATPYLTNTQNILVLGRTGGPTRPTGAPTS